MNKFSQLNHTHFQYRIWRNELEMMQKETDFFLSIVEEIAALDTTGKLSRAGLSISFIIFSG